MKGLVAWWRRLLDDARGSFIEGIPSWIPQTVLAIVVWLGVMAALTFWMPVWKDADVAFFEWIGAPLVPEFSPDVVLVDTRSWESNNKLTDRREIGAFLERLVAAKQKPKAVILDFEFAPCESQPCGAP
ncbi:MAG: hypothetical protein JOY59_13780, partial [Candidatus Eremiobacteraeota bacterium]|nr:hypothetical protein [Candidatus Eremiobacteraeota bacterium]